MKLASKKNITKKALEDKMKNYTAQFREEVLKISDEIGLQKMCENLGIPHWHFQIGEKLLIEQSL